MRTTAPLLAFPGSLASWLLAGAAFAQAPPAPPAPEVFFETLDVNVVNVEVFVTDQGGKPVVGLGKDDFELLEDGNPVPITNFLALESGQLVGAPASAAGEAPAPMPQSQRLHVVIFVDDLNLAPKDRNSVIDALRRFLRQGLDHDDRVMLTRFDGTLHVERDFTSLPDVLQPLLDMMEKKSSRGFETENAMRGIIGEIDGVSLSDTNTTVNVAEEQSRHILESIRSFAQEMQVRNRLSLDAMGVLIESLAGLPGRKALLYVGGGVAQRPGEVLFEAWNNKFGEFSRRLGASDAMAAALDYDSTRDLSDLVGKASANRVVIYTIDSVSNRSFGAVSAEVGGFDFGSIGNSSGGRSWTNDLDSRWAAGFRNSLQFLAENSGGLTFINTKALSENLTLLANDFSTYYSLGYTPRHQRDGSYHRLQVKVAGDGYRVRHRSGFRDKTPDEEMSDRTLSALLLNVSENPLGVTLERGPDRPSQTRRNKEVFKVPLLVKIPIGKLALLPQEGFHHGKISVFVAVSDSSGGNSRVTRLPLPVKVPADRLAQAQDQWIGHELTLEMRGGYHRLAIAVRDEVAAISSTIRFNFRVGG